MHMQQDLQIAIALFELEFALLATSSLFLSTRLSLSQYTGMVAVLLLMSLRHI